MQIKKILPMTADKAKREEYVKSFQLASKDPEIVALAEEGMDDYLEIIKTLEITLQKK